MIGKQKGSPKYAQQPPQPWHVVHHGGRNARKKGGFGGGSVHATHQPAPQRMQQCLVSLLLRTKAEGQPIASTATAPTTAR